MDSVSKMSKRQIKQAEVFQADRLRKYGASFSYDGVRWTVSFQDHTGQTKVSDGTAETRWDAMRAAVQFCVSND